MVRNKTFACRWEAYPQNLIFKFCTFNKFILIRTYNINFNYNFINKIYLI